jgi:hypothetical protein
MSLVICYREDGNRRFLPSKYKEYEERHVPLVHQWCDLEEAARFDDLQQAYAALLLVYDRCPVGSLTIDEA